MKLIQGRNFAWNLTKNVLPQGRQLAVLPIPPRQNNVAAQKEYSSKSLPQKQKLLPFPVQKLNDTLAKFMKTALPFLTEKEITQQQSAIQEFATKEGPALQKLLESASKKEKNWLADRWLKAAYMQFREPVTIFSSPGMTFPLQQFENQNDYLNYTAKVIYILFEFKQVVDAGLIPIVKMGKFELDNSQFSKVFGTCRIPHLKEDKMSYSPESNYVVVIYKNHFYKLKMYNADCELLTPRSIVKEFQQIIQCEKEKGPAYGLLTTDQRDQWAIAYKEIMKIPENKNSIKIIQNSTFTVSLDDCITPAAGQQLNELALQLIHGGGADNNGGNRWMDKTIQLIANPNGMIGFCYEHSPAEGQPIAMMMDYVIEQMPKKDFNCGGDDEDYTPATKLKVKSLEGDYRKYVSSARRSLNKLRCDLKMHVLVFDKFGKNFIKKQRLSPDSFVQMAIQLAFYSLHKEPAAQYESAHLRIFEGGRTETIRSCSCESVEFAKAMLSCDSCDEERVKLLRAAVDGHRKYTMDALQGRGVDRHFLGLKMMAIENKKSIPKFFKSPGVVKSSHFRVSTSQVATKNMAFMAYGPGVQDGYGCCYNPRNDDIIFAVSAWKSNCTTDADGYACAIADALERMRRTLQAVETKSKL